LAHRCSIAWTVNVNRRCILVSPLKTRDVIVIDLWTADRLLTHPHPWCLRPLSLKQLAASSSSPASCSSRPVGRTAGIRKEGRRQQARRMKNIRRIERAGDASAERGPPTRHGRGTISGRTSTNSPSPSNTRCNVGTIGLNGRGTKDLAEQTAEAGKHTGDTVLVHARRSANWNRTAAVTSDDGC